MNFFCVHQCNMRFIILHSNYIYDLTRCYSLHTLSIIYLTRGYTPSDNSCGHFLYEIQIFIYLHNRKVYKNLDHVCVTHVCVVSPYLAMHPV